MPKLSIVSPVYGSPELIPTLCQRLHASLEPLGEEYEIILVFDCSPDNGWQRILEECEKDARVKGICLSRNFGQHYAITAGLRHVSGEWVVVMDCDLQDRPEEIPRLFQKALEGYDIVLARRTNRQDNFLKRASSKLFFMLFSYMTDSKQDATIANFGVYRRQVINAVLSMNDKARCFPIMVQWVGFRKTALSVEHSARESGKSTYSFRKLCRLAVDSMLAFSDKPLRLTVQLGMLVCLGSVVVASYYFMRYLVGGITVSGYASLILSIWFLSGMIIFILGILGIYLGRVFDQVKDRPTFIVSKMENIKDG